METGELFHTTIPSRQARLNAFLIERGVTTTQLAERLGCTLSHVSDIKAGRKTTAHLIQKMIELGIPAELLPEPNCSRPGPRPRIRTPAGPESARPGTGFLSKLKRVVGL